MDQIIDDVVEYYRARPVATGPGPSAKTDRRTGSGGRT